MSGRATINKLTGLMRPGQLIRRIPFTLCMLLVLLLAAWWTQSYFQDLTRAWISQLGFAPRDFWFFRWERLVLSALVTNGGSIFWFALGMVAITSGIAEWKAGSGRAVAAFWGVHLATLLLESLMFLLPLHQLGFSQAHALFFSRDVGPSAGYMGGLGFMTTYLPKPWRWIVFGAMLLFLIIYLLMPPRPGETMAVKLSADLAHLLAYPLGVITATVFGNTRRQ